MQIDAGGASLAEVRTNAKGYRLATTVQGPATGKGAHFTIVDDPFKAAEAASESTRNAVYDWFKGSLMTRFDKPAEGAMVVVQQRLHQDDLIGRLRDEGGWEYLEMPGECVERQVFDLGDGETWAFNPGDLLFEERFNRAALEQLFWDLGEGPYNAQILQRPSPPGGALFKLKHFQRYETAPLRYEAIHQSWDPAIVDTETAAFSVCTTWGIIGRKLYLLDVLRKRLDFHKIEPAILHMKEKYNASSVVLETSGVGIAIGNALVQRPGARSWLHPHDPKLGKVERAIAQTPKIERKRVYLPVSAPWLETFESEVATFPMSKYADQVELHGAISALARRPYPLDHEPHGLPGLSRAAVLTIGWRLPDWHGRTGRACRIKPSAMLKDGFGVVTVTASKSNSFPSFNHPIRPSGHVRSCLDLDRRYAEKIVRRHEVASKPSVPIDSDDTHAADATRLAQDRLGPVVRLLERTTPRGEFAGQWADH